MFGFLNMMGTYEQRKVDNTVINEVEIDTVMVTDCEQPYETAIKSKHYNNDKWVIVEQYDTKEESIEGHKKWVSKFSKKLPKTVKDVSTCEIASLITSLFPEKDKKIE
jgi:hypothetical protein